MVAKSTHAIVQYSAVAGSWALQAVYRLELEFRFVVGVFGAAMPSCAAGTTAIVVIVVHTCCTTMLIAAIAQHFPRSSG